MGIRFGSAPTYSLNSPVHVFCTLHLTLEYPFDFTSELDSAIAATKTLTASVVALLTPRCANLSLDAL